MRRNNGAATLGLVTALAVVGSAAPPSAQAKAVVQATAVVQAKAVMQAATTERKPLSLRTYFLKGEKLAVAGRRVPYTTGVARAALLRLLAGPNQADRARGLTTCIPSGTRLLGVRVAGGTAIVDLSKNFAQGGGSLSMMARLAQVTFTATQFPTVTRVSLMMAGKVVNVFGGEGIMIDRPLARAGFEALAPAILVETPTAGQVVSTPVRVSGTANVFEGVFRAELRDRSGHVLARRTVHATAGTGTRGSYSVTLPFSPEQAGNAYLSVYNLSPKDGSPEHRSRIPLVLTRS